MNKAILALAVGLLGCGSEPSGRSAARLSEIEVAVRTNSSTTIDRLEINYDSSRLAGVDAFQNGNPNGTSRLTYDGDRISRIDYTDKEGDRAFTSFEYVDDYLWKTHYEVTNAVTLDQTVWYDEATAVIKELAFARKPQGGNPHNWLTRYEYDMDGRVTKMMMIDGSETTTSELRYNLDGTIERATSFTGMAHNETWDFRYRPDGLIDGVDDTHGNSTLITYNANNLIDEVQTIEGESVTTYSYTYEDGKVSGLTFAPQFTAGSQFDLAGKSYSDLALLHIAPPIETAIEHGQANVCDLADGSACMACVQSNCCTKCMTSTCEQSAHCIDNCNGNQSCYEGCAAQYPQDTGFMACELECVACM